MTRTCRSAVAAGTLLAAFIISGCGAPQAPLRTGVAPTGAPATTAAKSPADYPGRYPFNAEDVSFMTGMIAHHSQAIAMANWAPTHGASASLRALCERIVVAQTDEITLMRRWLTERHQPVPDGKDWHMHMDMGGMDHVMFMPGMLTEAQMAALDNARGVDFDRLFLTGMIQHHLGAIDMVNTLFGTEGSGQDEVVFRFASDVYADQTTEIDRMTKMLNSLPGSSR